MAQPPPRTRAAQAGGPAKAGGAPSSSSGLRAKDGEKQPGTFFLGRYRVVDEIGVGGMASVHLARMDGPGGFQKWVAIKRIHPHLVEDDQFVDMFLDEARIAAGINHANVAQVFDLGKDDNTYWIAMEYLHGEPLREVMRRAEERRVAISPELAARICSDGAEGLHAAHELRGKNGQLLGLVHRDVTPHNLFLTYDGYTKVVDFGIAKVADRLSSTRAGTLKGKLAYMSPEQVRGAEVDRTTDIFALGVVLWELTTNQRLFRMDTDLDTLEKVQACVVPPPSTLVADYPPELESVVLKALAKRKQDRFQTGREFSRALQSFLMRRGSFVGPEEVAGFVRSVFADRIQKREAHLAWAAEVTSTINVEQLRGGSPFVPSEDSSLDDDDGGRRGRSSPPVSGGPGAGSERAVAPPVAAVESASAAQMAASSLMDDDEDVPTTVAMRETVEPPSRTGPAPRPAAGVRPMPPAAAPPPRPPSPPPFQGAAPRAPGFGQPPAAYPDRAHAPAPPAPRPYGHAPSGASADDLGATIAFPGGDQPRPFGGQYTPAGPPPAPPAPTGAYNGQGYGAPAGAPYNPGYAPTQQQPFPLGPPSAPHPAAPGYGPQQQDLGPPAFGGPAGPQPGHFPFPNQPGYGPRSPQSHIETALSLPRPDPAALWLAQQEKQRGEKKNTGVLAAVIAFATLCVFGIGALVYFKLRAAPSGLPQGVAEAQSGGSVASAAPAAPVDTASAAPSAPPPPPASASAVPTASASASATPSATSIATAAPAPPPVQNNTPPSLQPPSVSAAGKDDPGFLTVVCNPYCDDVGDGGKSLGPSPIVHLSVKPGQHRLTLKKGDQKKVISVIVVSGQVTAQRVSMK